MQPNETVPWTAVEEREISADDHLASGLDRHRIDIGVGPKAWIEAQINRAIAIQARHRTSIMPIDRPEQAADHNFALVAQSEGIYRVIRPCPGTELGIG